MAYDERGQRFVFQFLLGRLETTIFFCHKFQFTGFQFLLGRLETRKLCCRDNGQEPFQFLLGRLETDHCPQHTGGQLSRFNSS